MNSEEYRVESSMSMVWSMYKIIARLKGGVWQQS